MKLPALLPKNLAYSAEAEDGLNLLNMLVKIPHDFIVFFEYACDDETWSGMHGDFMELAIQWMTNHFYQDKMLVETAQRAVSKIREHYHILYRYIPNNITFNVNGTALEQNSMFWAASSDFFRSLLRNECRDQNKTELTLDEVDRDVFDQIEEFIRTGTVKELWRKDQPKVFEVLRQATEWGLTDLMLFCEDILKRYIARGNVIDTMIMSHEEGWQMLKEACMDFINGLDVGVHFESGDPDHLAIEFLDFREDALDIFEGVHFHLTHLICGHNLTEQASFSDVVNRCPSMICLDISRSRTFSDRLVDIPESLEELNVSKCLWLSNKNLENMIEICPNLSKITMSSNVQTDYAGWGLLRKLKKLNKLDISGCFQVNDEDFKIILQACRKVTHFYMQLCTGLSDEAFYELAKNIPKLTDLDISRCSISDAALIDLVTRCKQLYTLNLTRCTNLTEKGVIEAVRFAPNLQFLNITKCRLPALVVDNIKEVRPFLEVVS